MNLMFRCPKTKKYTLKRILDGVQTINPHPPKFEPLDKVGKYRRKIKYREIEW
ncbi:MAG: nucleolar RNA-binding Nop10p family protein [Candidatus Anstonellaceae archaeon]